MTSRRCYAIHLLVHGGRGVHSAVVYEFEPGDRPWTGGAHVNARVVGGMSVFAVSAEKLAPLAEEEVAEYLLLPEADRHDWRWARAKAAEEALARGEWRPRWWEVDS